MFDNIIDIYMYMLEVLTERGFKFCPKFKSKGEVSRLEPAPLVNKIYNFLFSYTLFLQILHIYTYSFHLLNYIS
jgi:hypothetical protein